jgi:hypothetical protein
MLNAVSMKMTLWLGSERDSRERVMPARMTKPASGALFRLHLVALSIIAAPKREPLIKVTTVRGNAVVLPEMERMERLCFD